MNEVTSQSALAEKLRTLAELKERKKELADLTKENNELIEQTEKETISILLDMAEKSGLDDPSAFTVKLDGRQYGLSTKHYYNIKAEDKDAAFAALRELGLGDIIVESVNRSTLTNTLAQIAADNGGELPEAYQAIPMQDYPETKITDRKAGR